MPTGTHPYDLMVSSPVSKVPPELLSEIFVRASNDFHYLTGVHTPIPSTLSLVSRLWRDIAINLPYLWNSLTFDSQHGRRINLATILERYLRRARDAPISFRGTLLNADERDIETFDAILRSSRTWCDVQLRISHTLIPRLNTVDNRVPTLKTLSLSVMPPHTGSRWIDSDIMAFISAPSLHHISVCDFTLRHALLPSDQIDTLTATDTDLRFTNLLLIHSYTNLTHLVLRGWSTPGFNDKPIHLPSLKSLCVVQDRASKGSPLENLFELMDVPILDNLHVEGSYGADEALIWSTTAFVHMTERHSSFPLKSLSLSNIMMQEDDLLLALIYLPMLEKLTVVEGDVDRLQISDTFIRGLLGESSLLLVPRLSALNISGRLQFTPSSFMELIHSRSPSSVDDVADPKHHTSNIPRVLCSASLTLLAGIQGTSEIMRRLLSFDPVIPLSVPLTVEDREETIECEHCRHLQHIDKPTSCFS